MNDQERIEFYISIIKAYESVVASQGDIIRKLIEERQATPAPETTNDMEDE
jgi:hypothetical protein